MLGTYCHSDKFRWCTTEKKILKHQNITIPALEIKNPFIWQHIIGPVCFKEGGGRGVQASNFHHFDDESMNLRVDTDGPVDTPRLWWPILINHPCLTVRLYRAIITPISHSSHCVTDRNNHRGARYGKDKTSHINAIKS